MASAPPMPIGGKLLVALLMLLLVAGLVRAMRGLPISGRSIGAAFVVAVAVVLVLEAVLPRAYAGRLHDLGVLAAVAGALSGAALLRPVVPGEGRKRSSQTIRAAAVAFVCGPVVGLILASLTVQFAGVSTLDRAYTYGVFSSIGTLAGLIAALFVAVAAASRSPRSSGADEKH